MGKRSGKKKGRGINPNIDFLIDPNAVFYKEKNKINKHTLYKLTRKLLQLQFILTHPNKVVR